MDEFIARENIKRFAAQLRSSPDEGQKDVLRRLLQIEEQKLQEVRASKRPAR